MTRYSAFLLRLLIVWTLSFVLPATLASLFAENGQGVPSWRQGVSKWTGSGYEMPADVDVAPVPLASEASSNAAPYTVPIDPTTSAHANPYVQPPVVDDLPLNMPLSSDSLSLDASVMFTAPNLAPSVIAAPDNSRKAESTPSSDKTDPAPQGTPPSVEELPAPAKKPPTAKPAESKASESKASESKASKSTSTSDKFASAEAAVEPAPLESEVIHWYQYPRKWMRGWDSHAELGLDGSNGNADTLAIQTGLELKRKTDFHTLALDVDYRQASNRDVTTEDNGRFNLDYDRLLLDSPWAAFGKFGLEWDKFKAFDLRVNLNGGVGYHWIRTDDATLVTRFGAGASQEIGAPDDDWIAEGVFGIEAERQLTSRQKLKGRVDYFPAWEDFSNYRLVSDFAWEILLDGSDNLSLKLAATDRYDSTPQGAKPNDVYYSLLLLYKF